MSISFREDFGLWWPDYDHKPVNCYRRVKSRVKDVDVGVKYCRYRRSAVQAGGHVGEWPRRLSRRFQVVHTFEPEKALYECMRLNLANVCNVTMSSHALGPVHGTVNLRPHQSAGSWRVSEDGTVPVTQYPLDALELDDCDLICLDIEGYEVDALKGALSTIEKCKPVIYLEMLDRNKRSIIEFMVKIGYVLIEEVHSDAVFVSAR